MAVLVQSNLEKMTIEEVFKELRALRQIVVDAEFVSRARFCGHGLCDCIDNNGTPYPSGWADEWIKAVKAATPVSPHLRERHAG